MSFWVTLASISLVAQNPGAQRIPKGADPKPKPAISAILKAFDRYEVVGLSAGHSLKDQDDFILALIRTPAFADKVNDIVVECGNSLYQKILDRYITGEDVPFAEVRKVWRNTTQLMCGMSGFYDQLFPLIRAINIKQAPDKRIRVLAGDPPIEWEHIKALTDIKEALIHDRDQAIAQVMEDQVLSKHRRALMLFGVFHLMHQGTHDDPSAVAIYEKQYPNRTLVIAEFETMVIDLSATSLATWSSPSIAKSKGTWLGALRLSQYESPPMTLLHCVGRIGFAEEGADRTMAELVDAFLYLAPPGLLLKEQIPASIASDPEFTAELSRRADLLGIRWMVPWADGNASSQIQRSAEDPLLEVARAPDQALLMKTEEDCRESTRKLRKREPPPLPGADEPFPLSRD